MQSTILIVLILDKDNSKEKKIIFPVAAQFLLRLPLTSSTPSFLLHYA